MTGLRPKGRTRARQFVENAARRSAGPWPERPVNFKRLSTAEVANCLKFRPQPDSATDTTMMHQ